MVIQPLEHQKLTNIKEHQDIINKINELIANNIEFPALIPNTYLHVNSEGLLEFSTIAEGRFVWGSGTGNIDDQEDLKEKFDDVGEHIDGIEDEIGEESTSGTIRGDIKKNKDDIAALDPRVEAIEDAITEIDQDIIDLNNDKVDKTAIKTVISSTLTDNDVVSGKTVYEKCYKVDFNLLETSEYRCGEHILANGLTFFEGHLKQFTINGATGKSITITIPRPYLAATMALTPFNFTGFADVSFATQFGITDTETTISVNVYNTSSTAITVTGVDLIGLFVKGE